ncbi:DUF1266 domain-containing protein [Paenibacillus sp. JCM 10914]|uniref:DUF1266 domain-containing protein n=1 Tax=Paenibacillus sp. JCM 10914 TaxID=1236974 RepID=UPI0003CC8BDC|nr:DUF1266 domain-containing protein [Paenibacillus sp. JCM 10914]GAE06675.1 hypothetical protein JCM10914_2846 [Paenibacillus sp. JCM 10914]
MDSYTRKETKQLELYFRCLSGVCLRSMLAHYYIPYEFHTSERWLRNHAMKQALQFWSISGDASLREKIEFLLEDGYRQSYRDLHARLAPLSFAARERYVKGAEDDPDYNKLVIIQRHMTLLPSADITAIGGGWAIMLSRLGRVYRTLSKEEAWNINLRAARLLQQHYSSWEAYFSAFAIGMYYITDDVKMRMPVKYSVMPGA